MQITLSTTNWLARYYYWVRGAYPTTLCPYFWSMIIFIIGSPIIIALKGIIFCLEHLPIPNNTPKKIYTPEQLAKRYARGEKIDEILEIFGKIVLVLFLSVIAGLLIFVCFKQISEVGLFQFLVGLFALIGVVISIILLMWGIIELDVFEKISKSMIVQVPVQAISGAYHKMCPRIFWITPEKK